MSFPSDEQKRIISCTSPIIALDAPHGTGKTRTLAHYLYRQVQREKYQRIVVVTLTNAAARSMERAVKRALGTTEIHLGWP
jgi:ATP-dependent exoDNAse (exonuclease V) beta subunit